MKLVEMSLALFSRKSPLFIGKEEYKEYKWQIMGKGQCHHMTGEERNLHDIYSMGLISTHHCFPGANANY